MSDERVFLQSTSIDGKEVCAHAWKQIDLSLSGGIQFCGWQTKDMVRLQGDPLEQLKLAHDFRKAALGTPRVVRRMLARYHLPEMPEAWNQQAFDHHVHDANTKGRKSPTHLVMDAWLKGLRFITVVYYNTVDPEAASELLRAARIMGITVRIGIPSMPTGTVSALSTPSTSKINAFIFPKS